MTKEFVLEALLRHNYFPMQKMHQDEMPPVFSSTGFQPSVAEALDALAPRKGGYDSVEYRATRFNLVPRRLSIPHPLPYSRLARRIAENWEHVSYIAGNEVSVIRPRQHADGRLIVMDYESSRAKQQRANQMQFGCRFTAHADVANCFPSVYSHAVPWAVVGFAEAKSKQGPAFKDLWFNQLDIALRATNRNETNGVAVGPATSNVLSEAILARVDEELSEFRFVRFIDDYTAYCHDYNEAERFIDRLGIELGKYRFLLNPVKTRISALPSWDSDWVSGLALALPHGKGLDPSTAQHYLNHAVAMSHKVPDASILKFAVKSLCGRHPDAGVVRSIMPQVLGLAFHRPALLPAMASLFSKLGCGPGSEYSAHLARIAAEHARQRRSDGMCWSLHYLNKYGDGVTDDVANAVVGTQDCSAMAILGTISPQHLPIIIQFKTTLDGEDAYALDRYWLLLYQLFRSGSIDNPYPGDKTFGILRDAKVDLIRSGP